MVKHILKKTACGLALFLCLLNSGSATATFSYPPAAAMGSGQADPDHISTIMAVLEAKSSDQKILNKAAEKLHKLNDDELRLMSSLCDRISIHNDNAGADIAFSLITAMIVLT